MSWIRLLSRSAVILLALLSPAFAQTGSLDIAWNPTADTDVSVYRIRYGTDPANLSDTVEVPSNQTTAQLTGLKTGVEYVIRVSTVRPSGCESAPSTELRATPPESFGPECTSVSLTGLFLQESTASLTVRGSGFDPGIQLSFFDGNLDLGGTDMLTVVSQSVPDPSTIQLTIHAGDFTPVGPVSIGLENPDPLQSTGSCTDALLVGFNLGRADINGSLRVEGADLASIANLFGTFDRICAPDSPNGPARGDRCDGEDDCGGAPGVTDYCTAQACEPGSPAGAGMACRQEVDCGGNGGTSYCAPTLYRHPVDLDGNGLVDGIDLALLQPLFGRNVGP